MYDDLSDGYLHDWLDEGLMKPLDSATADEAILQLKDRETRDRMSFVDSFDRAIAVRQRTQQGSSAHVGALEVMADLLSDGTHPSAMVAALKTVDPAQEAVSDAENTARFRLGTAAQRTIVKSEDVRTGFKIAIDLNDRIPGHGQLGLAHVIGRLIKAPGLEEASDYTMLAVLVERTKPGSMSQREATRLLSSALGRETDLEEANVRAIELARSTVPALQEIGMQANMALEERTLDSPEARDRQKVGRRLALIRLNAEAGLDIKSLTLYGPMVDAAKRLPMDLETDVSLKERAYKTAAEGLPDDIAICADVVTGLSEILRTPRAETKPDTIIAGAIDALDISRTARATFEERERAWPMPDLSGDRETHDRIEIMKTAETELRGIAIGHLWTNPDSFMSGAVLEPLERLVPHMAGATNLARQDFIDLIQHTMACDPENIPYANAVDLGRALVCDSTDEPFHALGKSIIVDSAASLAAATSPVWARLRLSSLGENNPKLREFVAGQDKDFGWQPTLERKVARTSVGEKLLKYLGLMPDMTSIAAKAEAITLGLDKPGIAGGPSDPSL